MYPENSRLLSYASQLPTEEPDDELEDQVEMVCSFLIFVCLYFYCYVIGIQASRDTKSFRSLPSANDEEYGLSDEEM